MRKRSKYRPRPIIANPLAYVMEGFTKIVDKSEDNLRIRLRVRTSLQSIIEDKGTMQDLNALVSAANMTTALSRSHGYDWRNEILDGVNAVEAMQLRLAKWGKVQATPTELDKIRMLVDIHDAQLDEARVMDLEKAIAIARLGEKSVKEIA